MREAARLVEHVRDIGSHHGAALQLPAVLLPQQPKAKHVAAARRRPQGHGNQFARTAAAAMPASPMQEAPPVVQQPGGNSERRSTAQAEPGVMTAQNDSKQILDCLQRVLAMLAQQNRVLQRDAAQLRQRPHGQGSTAADAAGAAAGGRHRLATPSVASWRSRLVGSHGRRLSPSRLQRLQQPRAPSRPGGQQPPMVLSVGRQHGHHAQPAWDDSLPHQPRRHAEHGRGLRQQISRLPPHRRRREPSSTRQPRTLPRSQHAAAVRQPAGRQCASRVQHDTGIAALQASALAGRCDGMRADSFVCSSCAAILRSNGLLPHECQCDDHT